MSATLQNIGIDAACFSDGRVAPADFDRLRPDKRSPLAFAANSGLGCEVGMALTRLLIVDDNAVNLDIAQVVLAADKFTVEAASNAVDALEKVASFRPALILMDSQMPGMDGFELTPLFKSDPSWRHIRVIAFTTLAKISPPAPARL